MLALGMLLIFVLGIILILAASVLLAAWLLRYLVVERHRALAYIWYHHEVPPEWLQASPRDHKAVRRRLGRLIRYAERSNLWESEVSRREILDYLYRLRERYDGRAER